ncbi:MAG: membrane dipeptidase [Chitinophagaceae bacterium]|nr:membrane dipeptidase [Chitinophagaceae bacterium]
MRPVHFLICLLQGSAALLSAQTDSSRKPITVQAVNTISPGNLTLAHAGFTFEQGAASLTGWQREGNAFATQPTYGHNVTVRREMDNPKNPFRIKIPLGGDYWKDLALPVGEKGHYWIGTFENRPDSSHPFGRTQGTQPTGTLTSPVFTIEKKYITLLVGGSNDPGTERVELLWEGQAETIKTTDQIKPATGSVPLTVSGDLRAAIQPYKATGTGSNVMRRIWWDVSGLKGKTARIRITDASPAGFINVDDIRFQDTPPDQTDIAISSRLKVKQVFEKNGQYYDWDFPLWGSIDTHTHPAAHLGFGNRLFHGEPVGNINKALADCEISHGADVFRTLTSSTGERISGNIVRNAVAGAFDPGHRLGVMDPGNTWGTPEQTLAYWPLYNTKLHQQMWKDWLKRAFDGGLRMIVALTVHNQVFARISEGTRPDDDKSVGDKQIEYIKNVLAPACRDWMEIAYSPADMRRIMLAGKMAVILGSELDNIGNFDGKRSPTEAEVRAEIRRLYNLGLRYMFPVHLLDNGLGGTAIKSDIFNLATKFNTGRPFDVELKDYKDGFSEYRLKAKFDLLNSVAPALIEANNKAIAYGGIAGAAAPLVVPVAAPALLPFMPVIATAGGTVLGMAAPLIPVLAGVAVHKWTNDWGISLDVIPVGNNYPAYPWKRYAGHINRLGLTSAGQVAVNEMMRLGMMIDIDHAGRKTVDGYFNMAFAVPGGYPLNSGHNQFTETRWTEAQLLPESYNLSTAEGRKLYANHYEHITEKIANENDRSPSDLQRIKQLGGMMGVGISGANPNAFDRVVPAGSRRYTSSVVANDNPGSTKAAAQLLLYAIEKMKGNGVCFGTDINGFAGLVGPRFGTNSASSAGHDRYDLYNLRRFVYNQTGAVKYTPFTDLTGNRFRGRLTGSGSKQKDDPAGFLQEGKLFTEEQGDFMMALQLYYTMDERLKREAESGETKTRIDWLLSRVVHNSYDKNRIKEFVKGLIKGGNGEGIGTDIFNGDVGTQQQIACKVSRERIFNNRTVDSRISDVVSNAEKNRRYRLLDEAFTYYGILSRPGNNEPLLPSSTLGKTWNYNLDGMAHYGLMPDFFQDLKNVGMKAADMSVLFNSAEDFARMWERCIRQSEKLR